LATFPFLILPNMAELRLVKPLGFEPWMFLGDLLVVTEKTILLVKWG
jgi:hypothetical protein